MANSWILEVVQIHLCQVFLGLYWSDEGTDGIILPTKKYMKRLFNRNGSLEMEGVKITHHIQNVSQFEI